ncbi:hypothetical protein [Kutzneria buriramensis]|uniref:Uncharacterized protein n=1 Tax=Kutzneria buriramensis TaxID=1045776 RepID=A0A3E0GWU6_9PSEU|nr:hypothetical protein [Kutzneria buriramensis]REH28643.1 hypothetical protein BCF44_12685 [Kutzneria buriramensis]
MTRTLHAHLREDRGVVSVGFALGLAITIVLLAFVATVHGGNDTQARADAIAAEAARAALTALNTRGTTVTIDPAGAQNAARSYLAAAGATGTVTITGPTTVTVTVAIDRPAVFTLFGASNHATATKKATLVVARA